MKLEQIKNQNRFFRFLFGSKAKDVEELKNQIKTNQEKIVELKNTVGEMTDEQVKARLETQINTLEQVKTQIETETIEETSDFSLFGWVKNLFK
jgi:regulator of replication initiation timing